MSGPATSTAPAAASAASNDAASEAAYLLAALVVDSKAMPREAAEDLARLLEHSLAVPHVARRRQQRIGLLVELISAGGQYIDTETYEQACAERAEVGESWPAASTLSRGYGHWLVAVRAACRFWFDGGQGHVCRDHAHLHTKRHRYEPRQIIDAILKAQAALKLPADCWPTEWEYYEWARIKRRLARRSGNPCLLPERPAIRGAYGGYEQALKATQRAIRSGAVGKSAERRAKAVRAGS